MGNFSYNYIINEKENTSKKGALSNQTQRTFF